MAGGVSSSANEVYDPNNRNNNRGLQSPFVLYMTVTLSTNGVAILGGIFSQFDLHRNYYYGFDRCDTWLFANAFFGVLHIGAAIYLVKKIREPERGHASNSTTYGYDTNDGVLVTGYQLHNPRDTRNPGQGNGYIIPTGVATPAAMGSIAGPPDSLRRVRYVLCESKLFAGYIIVFLVYLCWHFFLDMRACNLGMAFAMRCADVFIWASPCSFAFSVGALKHRQGRL